MKHRELVDYVHGFVTDPAKEDGYLDKGSSIISNQVRYGRHSTLLSAIISPLVKGILQIYEVFAMH